MGTLVLEDLLSRIHEFDPDLVAYIASDAEPSGSSEVELLDYQGPQTPKPRGKTSLLGVRDIIDVLETWSKWRKGRKPNKREMCDAVLFYAQHDGYLPVNEPR